MDFEPDPYFEDLARRLHAAYESHRLRLAGVDRTLKRYESVESVGEYWNAVARLVDRDSREAANRIIDAITGKGLRLVK